RQYLSAGILGCALWLAGAGGAAAQGTAGLPGLPPADLPVALIADEIRYDAVNAVLTASGEVQVFHGERTLTARAIHYDARNRTIRAEGPLVLRDPSGSTIFADYAELDPDLREGLLRSASAVLARRLRIAAVEGRRLEGRFNVLDRAVFSSCEVCTADPVPLWRIRARRIIHDQDAKVIHYQDATFDVAGVPVFYLPYFRHPDPTLARSTGFLMPSVKTSDTFGYGLKTPFYWAIDPHSDLTVTPFLTTDSGPVLELEYRRAFARGSLLLMGSITPNDEGGDRAFRGHLFGDGHYFLTDDIILRARPNLVSDDGYLTDFEFSDVDRLTSELTLGAWRKDGFWELGAVFFQSLRDAEPAGAIPFVLPEFELRELWRDGPLGGTLDLDISGAGLRRTAGPDVMRAGIGLGWERSWITDRGIVLTGHAAARADLFGVWDSPDPAALPEGFQTRVVPSLGMTASWPFLRADSDATHVIEPVAQLWWSESSIDQSRLPNEDSLLVELDKTNLFDLSRFPGRDRVETGLRANLGLRYDRIDSRGWTIGGLVGRIFRTEPEAVFAGVPALAGAESDYIGALTLSLPPHVDFVGRVLLNDDFTFDRNDLRLDLTWDPVTLSGSYIYLSRDLLGGAITPREELSLASGWRVAPNWLLSGDITYDIQNNDFVRARAGITWANECVEVDFSVSRRFTRSLDVEPSTSFGIQVRLPGLGADTRISDAPSRCQLRTP
ncbi:MAG: LPS-assembly protein LptD, partial [Alphaproteobacteria bacterium]